MIQQAKTRLDDLTAGFTVGQKVLMGFVFVAVVGGLWWFSSWAGTTDYAPLYTDLETSDAASVVDELDSMGVDHQLANQGRTVLVPRDQVYRLRLDLSAAGVPDGGSQGYSLLDDQGITSTQFQQRVAFQRALEGELAATIRSIDAVESASVHLVIPRDDLFVGDDIQSTASVLVHTASTIGPEQVEAIVNLVAGSVEGLRADAVTVADQNGFVLAAPGQSAFDRVGGGGDGETRAYEEKKAAEIQNLLTPVVGYGNVVVTVSAEMDWDASSTVRETHTPSAVADGAEPLVRVETTRDETYTTSASDGDGGTLGGNADPDTGASSQANYDLLDVHREYVFDSEITTSENSSGELERINVAVLINESAATDAQLSEIESLVSSAAGIDDTRGDTLAVSRLAFDETIVEALALDTDPAAAGAAGTSAAGGSDGMIRTAVLGVLGLLIVVMAALQFWRGRRDREEVEELDLVTLTNSLTAGAARPNLAATGSPSSTPVRPVTAGPPADNDLSPDEELRMLVDQQPDEVARLLRTWLADRRAVAR